MTPLPNPFLSDPVATLTAATATAAIATPPESPAVAAGPFAEPPVQPKEGQEAPAAVVNPSAAGLLDELGYAEDIRDVPEIFHHARKLLEEDRRGGVAMDELEDRGFNIEEFLSDLEDRPLFLRVPIKERP
jgi:hypothetical protein